ncbi:MAG TPA: DUF4129 domain-containing protein, partial [Iamia sp.]|nr:DUF4129 domain-containing protein [Iamia sp.]
ADGRLLVADPDPSAVTPADVRLARSLFHEATPPESLAEACIDDEGTIDPACLGDGQPGGPSVDVAAEVVPRACRREGSVSAECIERELGIDVPAACTTGGGGVDVGCLAEQGDVLVLTDQCLDDGRLRGECLDGRVYGVPDPGPTDGGSDTFVPVQVPADAAVSAPDADPRAPADDAASPERERPDAEGSGFLGGLFHGFGLLVLAGVVVVLLIAAFLALRGWRPNRRGPVVEPGDEEAHDRAVMAASVDASARLLDLSGDPRQAIIAAYALLLEGLAACAQGRHPAETPLEHLERVLAALDVRPEPLRELTALFGEARFSDHAMTDRQRDRARAALEAAAADLERVRETVG